MHELPFVDAHVHLWDLQRILHPWLTPPFDDDGPNGSVAAIAHNYLLEDYRTESARWNVVGMVHVEAGAAAGQALAETEWLSTISAERGIPNGLVAFAALDGPDVAQVLAAHACYPQVRGIRHIVNWHADPHRTYTPRDVTRDESWQRGFAMLAQHGLSFDLQAYPGQAATLAPLLARHPGIPVILDHAGMGIDDPAEWHAAMQLYAALPHVSIKISGLGFSVCPWDDAAVRDRVRQAIDIFGPARALAASDFPTDRLFASFDRTLDTYAAAIADLSVAEQRAIWGGNADRVYRLGLDLTEVKA